MTLRIISDKLFDEFTYSLQDAAGRTTDLLQQARFALNVCEIFVLQLRKLFNAHQFADQDEEIEFFKEIKPRFCNYYIYYACLTDLYIKGLIGTEEMQREYLVLELQRLEWFFRDNHEFHIYCRAGHTYLDERYFMRGMKNLQQSSDYMGLYADASYCSSRDRLVAEILAFEKFRPYLQHQLNLLNQPQLAAAQPPRLSKLNWTGTQTLLVELAYGLSGSGLINNGGAKVKEILDVLQQAFNITVKHSERIWAQAGNRKLNKTKLTDILSEGIERMRERNENE